MKHRIACKSKGKLSLGQKLEIIAQHQSRDPVIRKTQVSSRALTLSVTRGRWWHGASASDLGAGALVGSAGAAGTNIWQITVSHFQDSAS